MIILIKLSYLINFKYYFYNKHLQLMPLQIGHDTQLFSNIYKNKA